jgi:hypothetical protein
MNPHSYHPMIQQQWLEHLHCINYIYTLYSRMQYFLLLLIIPDNSTADSSENLSSSSDNNSSTPIDEGNVQEIIAGKL